MGEVGYNRDEDMNNTKIQNKNPKILAIKIERIKDIVNKITKKTNNIQINEYKIITVEKMYDNAEKGVNCDNVNSELNWHVEHVYIFHEMIVRVGDDGLVCVESDVFVEFKEADDDDDDDVIVVNYVIDENVLDECGEVGVKNDEVVIGDEYLGDVEVHVVHEIIYRGDDGDIVVLEDVCDEDVVMVHYDENDDVMVCSGVVVDENVLYECGEVVVKSDDIIGDVEMHIVHEITNRVEDVDLVVLERVVYDDVVVVHHDENDDVMVCSGVVVDENVLHECGEAGVDCDNVNSELNWHVEHVYIFHEMIFSVVG
ncbi:hypothetical protein KSF78_0002881 [Schistosoma japonicum]|nr:hypothetical protein KSF78_0002881 [Schistosoma japonicum]